MPKKLKIPKIPIERFGKFSDNEMKRIFEDISRKNKSYIAENCGRVNGEWILYRNKSSFTIGLAGERPPSMEEIRTQSIARREPVYLLTSDVSTPKDLQLFFLSPVERKVMESIKEKDSIKEREIQFYGDLREDIKVKVTEIPSGLIDKLKSTDRYLIGALQELVPNGMKVGATAALFQHKGETVQVASISQDSVRKRGYKTRSERFGWKRIERIHRTDDAVLDIFDTFLLTLPGTSLESFANSSEILLYKSLKEK